MTSPKKIMIIAEHMKNELSPVSKELIACAKAIGKHILISLNTILIGENIDKAAKTLSQNGTQVTTIESEDLKSEPKISLLEIVGKILEPYIRNECPDIIIAGHTSFGLSFLPQLAIHLDASCITGVSKITKCEEKLIYTRLICNGKFETQVKPEKKITAITVLPGAFSSQTTAKTKLEKQIHIKANNVIKGPVILDRITQPAVSDSSFDNADVIVAAGQGIGQADNLDTIRSFSEIFQCSTIAGSRPLIDMGWLPYHYQVGITGKTVAPKMYIACGISGSSQHVAGMSGSEYIVAINSDPNAAIFNISDLCIVEDLLFFIHKVKKH
ncbi:electron transfer flavoprotein subunit alpha [Candidatus Magnetomorum sp. HK-1]|nr:electron transfer flavoprotein subunit alpha [Candidatus Magnetomorum sp. HK-1]